MCITTIGIIGGGQLGSMLAAVALQWGFEVTVLDPNPNAPAGRIASKHIVSDYTCEDAIRELVSLSDCITYEFEHLPQPLIGTLKRLKASTVPTLEVLEIIQDKYRQKQHLRAHGLPVAPDCDVANLSDVHDLYRFLGVHQRIIVKCKQGGYDGKGTYFVHDSDQLEAALNYYGNIGIYAEAIINFEKELSLMVVKKGNNLVTYTVAENRHDQGILVQTIVPAAVSESILEKATGIAMAAIETFDTDGLFCVEMFLTAGGDIMINEIAPRAHNSGHYTIEACDTSQYESWMRLVVGMPPVKPLLMSPAAMVNILGPEKLTGAYRVIGLEQFAQIPKTKFHLYKKTQTAPRKKLGHLTSLGATANEALTQAKNALACLEVKGVTNHE